MTLEEKYYIRLHDEVLHLELSYPPRDGEENDDGRARFIELGLMDTRAADAIRVSYDFDRDGWRIEQASTFRWEVDDTVCDPDWQEVAFVKAWGRQRPEEEESDQMIEAWRVLEADD